MVTVFIDKNKRAIKNGFFWISLICTVFILTLFTIGFLQKGSLPDLKLFLIVLAGASIGFPLFSILIGFLRWSWDYSITNRNYNSSPFNNLASIGFKRIIKDENSKTKFISEFYTGQINSFLVDCAVDTQNDHNSLMFKFYTNHKPFEKEAFILFQKKLANVDGSIDFTCITKKIHHKDHRLRSIADLELELITFAKIIETENISPSEVAWH